MKRENLDIGRIELPEIIFDLDFKNATLNSITDKVSGNALVSQATADTLEIVEDAKFGRGMYFKSQSSNNVFSSTYNETLFPKVYNMMCEPSIPFSVLCVLDNTLVSSTSRHGILSFYNLDRFVGWSENKNLMHVYSNTLSQLFALGSYYTPIERTISYFFAGADVSSIYYIDSNHNYTASNSAHKANPVTATGTIDFGKSQESGYYLVGGFKIYKLKIYQGILTQEQIDYILANNI